jgi:Thioesterase-like superfamily
VTTDAFYLREDDDLFVSTEHTIGPWGPDAQHGGPPAALLGRAIEGVPAATDMQVARITFDILKPVPIEQLRVTTEIVRDGRRVQLVESSLATEKDVVMRASAWRIRTKDVDTDAVPPVQPQPRGPDQGEAVALFETGRATDYLHSMEIRFVKGSFLEPGPATAWFRMRYPLVQSEDTTPLARVLIASDSASGISSALDFSKFIFINPDLDVHLNRMPEDEWVCLDAESTIGPHGIATSRCSIFDQQGPIGTGAQSLLVAAR